MIAELFYPRELKEIIADLRAKDDLNESALFEIDRQINMCIFFGILLCVVLIYTQDHFWVWSTPFLLILTCFVEARRLFVSYNAVYLKGVLRVGKLFDVQSRGGYVKKLIYQNVDGEICKKTPLLVENNYSMPLPKRGFGISYYYDPNGVYKAMPNLRFVKVKHCLSKSLLDEGI